MGAIDPADVPATRFPLNLPFTARTEIWLCEQRLLEANTACLLNDLVRAQQH
jgi:hypothetical protein